MKNQFRLSIKSPCSENFNEFSPTKNGGFCNSCQKEVIDFSKMNSKEITDYFENKNSEYTCGRFNSTQLKSFNKSYSNKKRYGILSSIGLACLSFFSMGTLYSQETEKAINAIENDTTKIKIQEQTFLVKGNVSENQIPLPGANIILEGTAIGTQTDFDGNFTFPKKLKKGDVLVFSYIGMDSKKISIINKDSVSNIELKVNMDTTSCILMGKVAVKKVYNSKRKK